MDYIEKYVSWCSKRDQSPETIAYKKSILAYMSQRIDLLSATTIRLEDELLEYSKGAAIKTYNNRLATLRSFYDFLEKYDLLEVNPARKIDRKKDVFKAQICFTDEEVIRIITMPRGEGRSAKEHVMYSLIFKLIAYTGMRRSEALGLLKGDIIPHEESPMVILRNTKNGDDRYCPIPQGFDNELLTYTRAHSVHYAFESRNKTKLQRSTLTRAFERRLRKLGLYKEKVGLHALRRARITRLITNHADLTGVMLIAGHKKADTTLRYFYANIGYLQEQSSKDPLFKLCG